MQRALERQKHENVRVVAIILRPCDWQHTPLKDVQCLPRDSKPVTEWTNPDAAFLDITNGLRRVIEQQKYPARPLSPQNRQDRIRMLKRMRNIWIDGLLAQSLDGATRIKLRLQERPDMLENPLRQQVQELDQFPPVLPEETTIVQVYDKAEGELLILGESGAGKTTLLLELTRTLLERAEQDERLPMPVVFNLSSWAEKRQPLRTWLTEELWTKYQVPRKIGKAWIDANQILPLLDGLDEVVKDVRHVCIEEINAYYQSRRGSLVVCCRTKEYTALSKSHNHQKGHKGSKSSKRYKGSETSQGIRLKLQQAVSIQPLTEEQINTYLEKMGEQVKALRQVLNEDAELCELARQPLMLNVLVLAYQGATAEEVPTGDRHDSQRKTSSKDVTRKGTERTQEEMQHTIFTRYVNRMFSRRKSPERWKKEQMIHYLMFLAKQMQQAHQTHFSVENLQPTWLSKKGKMFYQQCVELLWGQCGGLFIGFIGWLLGGWFLGFYEWLYFGLMFVVLNSVRIPSEINLKEILAFSWKKGVYALVYSTIVSMVFGLLGILIGSLLGWLLGWRVEGQNTRINPTEKLAWSWKKAGYMLLLCLITGPVFWLVARIRSGLFTNIVFELSAGLVYGVVTGIFSSLLVGLSGRQLPKHLSSNDGIWRSGRSGLFFGVVGGLVGGLLSGPFGSSLSVPTERLLAGPLGELISRSVAGWGAGLLSTVVFGLLGGLIAGLIIGWRCGLDAFIEHFLLRFLLWRSRSLPWWLIPFLDEAESRLFLLSAGGKYTFKHRMLLEYFSTFDDPLYSESICSEDRTKEVC